MIDPEAHDPEATVWRAVAELEKKGYTKIEIADAVSGVVGEMLQEQNALKH